MKKFQIVHNICYYVTGTGLSKLHEQLVVMQQELERKSEEIIQLKSVLANQTNNMKSILNSKTRTGIFIIFWKHEIKHNINNAFCHSTTMHIPKN